MNTQFAIQNGIIYVLEVNPRASRTIPFVSKAIGQPLAKIAAKAMAGITFKEQGFTAPGRRPYFSVKESVFPFIKFPDADPILGPEMKSTGEVMGTGRTFGEAYAKAQLASGVVLPRRGLAFISVRDRDKPGVVELGKMLIARGFEIVATGGTAKALKDGGVPCQRVNKVREGRPHVVDMIKNRELILDREHDRGKASDQGIPLDSRRGRDAQDHLLHDGRRREGDLRRARPSRQRRRESSPRSARGGRGLSKVPLTARGAAQLKEELRRLKIEERPKVTAAIATARAHGDLKENAEYHAAKEQQGLMEARIRDIEAKLSNAQIIDVTAVNAGGKVVFGSTVHLVDSADGTEAKYQIVGEDEADIKSGLLSIGSPIARALIGKKEGDEVDVSTPSGKRSYEITAVEYI